MKITGKIDLRGSLKTPVEELCSSRSRSGGQAGSTIFPVNVGLDTLRLQATNLVKASLSRNTLRVYKTAWRCFCSFMSLYPCNWVGDVKYMMAFTACCNGKLSLSFNTIKLYL